MLRRALLALLALAGIAAGSSGALAQTHCPYLNYGAVLTQGQWRNCLDLKQDWLGTPPLTLSNVVGVPPISATIVGSTVQISFSGTFTGPIKLNGAGTSNPTGTGQISIGTSTVNGGVISGQGSTYDVSLANLTGGIACGVPTGTQNLVCNGSVTTPNLFGGSAPNATLALEGSSNVAPSGDIIQLLTGNTIRERIDGVGNMLFNSPTTTVTQISSVGWHLNASGGGAFTVEALTPFFITIDQTGSGGGSTISHSSVWDTAVYDSAGTYIDAAFKFNPGFAYSHAGHMQSDVDLLGYMDGKGVEGLLAYFSGCTTSGNGSGPGACTINTNASWIPVPDALSAYSPATGGVVALQTVTGAVSSGGFVRLTVASTAGFTSGMYCYVLSVGGTTEANGRHICNVVDATHLLEPNVPFVHAFSASSGTVGVANPTDLGAAAHQWNDFWLGGDIYQAFGGITTPSVSGYRVFAQNSMNQTQGLGAIIEQYVANTPAFIIQTNSTGTVLGTLSNTAMSFYTNGILNFAMSAAGGFSVGTLTDPGAGAIYENNATFLIRTKTSFTNGSGASSGTLTNAPTAGNPTKWIAIDDNGTTRRIPAW